LGLLDKIERSKDQVGEAEKRGLDNRGLGGGITNTGEKRGKCPTTQVWGEIERGEITI